MLASNNPPDEAERLRFLAQLGVMDTEPEEVFDEISDLAAAICETPIALLSFVDEHRVWFKSQLGVAASEMSRDLSFCAYGISQKDLFVVPDTLKDERFKDNPLVIGEPKIRFYAGEPLVDRGGHILGMMCVLDRRPRELRPSQKRALHVLARLVMIELENRRSSERLQRLEVEAANLRLVGTMANHLLHEIGNAIVPISTHQQLLAERYSDPDFRRSLDRALAEGVRRVSRLISQMRHLADEVDHTSDPVSLQFLVEEAYKTAVRNQGGSAAKLHFDASPKSILINGDPSALTYAFSEIILNALQANPSDPEVEVHCDVHQPGNSPGEVIIDFRDSGGGFPPESVDKATQPFFTTRNVGPGLGLAVARKVVEKHRGSIEIKAPAMGEMGGVRIHLPLPPAATTQRPSVSGPR